MGNNVKELARIVFRHLPINWRIVIKRWVGLDLSLMEQLALIDIPSLDSSGDNGEVLFWRGVPGRGSIHSEAIIALALRMRGINTRFAMCDGVMSGCINRTRKDNTPISKWIERCRQCIDYGVGTVDSLGLPYIGMSELVSEERRGEFREICDNLSDRELTFYEYHQVPVGQFAKASTERYLKGLPLEGNELILREYLYSALVCSEAAQKALNNLKPNRVFMQAHIEYVSWAPAYVVLTRAGLPTTLWGGSLGLEEYITLRNVVGTDWSSRYSLSDEAWKRLSKQPLTTEQEKAVMISVARKPYWNRESTTHSEHVVEHSARASTPREKLLQKLRISDAKPIWCVFAHVPWDAGCYPENMVFKHILEWTFTTVQAMLQIKSVTWLLKAHPGESRGGIYGVEELVKDKFPEVSRHIHFIPAESKITTKDLYSILAGGVTMHGTVGVQLPVRGIPMIIGENTHYTGKGFTNDGVSRERYLELMHHAAEIPLLTEHERNLARRYTYAVYVQRSIPINMAQGRKGYTPLDPQKLHLLFPGNDEVMDMICDRIIDGGEFIL